MPQPLIFKIFLPAILIYLGFFSQVQAATVISPMLEIAGDSGTTQKALLKVYNETEEVLKLKASLETFSAGSETGQPVFGGGQNKDFLGWFKLSVEELELLPKQAAVVPFEVKIPDKALPGGYQAVIFWETLPADNARAVNITGKVGTLIFLKVNGEFKESAEIREFSIQPAKNIYFNLPWLFVSRLENTGNIYLSPKVGIQIENWLGQSRKFPVAAGQFAVLPESLRRFETIIPGQTAQAGFFDLAGLELGQLLFGPLKATITYEFGEPVQLVSKSISFWVFPWRLSVVVFGILLLSGLFIGLNRKVNRLKKNLKT